MGVTQQTRQGIPRLFMRTAMDMAAAFYEENRSDRFRNIWPDQRLYTLYNWRTFIPGARAILISQLSPDVKISTHLKDEIAKAVIEDQENGSTELDRLLLSTEE